MFYAGVADDSDSDNENDFDSESESDSDSDSDSDSNSTSDFNSDSVSNSASDSDKKVITSTYKQPESKFFGADDDDDVDDVVVSVPCEKEMKEHSGYVNLCRIVNKKFKDDKDDITTRSGTILVFKEPISMGTFKKINDELPGGCPRFHELLTSDTCDQVFFMPYNITKSSVNASVNTKIHCAIAKVLNRTIDSICVQGLELEEKVMVKKVVKPVVIAKPVPEKKLTGKAAWEAAQLAKAAAKEQAKNGANVNIKSERAPRKAPPTTNKNKNIKLVSEDDDVDLSDMDLLDKLGY
jgi:hypothetical protein